MHQLERITPAGSLAWRKPPPEYEQAVGYIEFLLWESGGELPLGLELTTTSRVALRIVTDYSNAGYEVAINEKSPTQFHITLSQGIL